MKILDRLFRLEEINGHDTCPTYLYRWTLLRLFGVAVYVHKFVGDDWSTDLHDHPKRFISFGLWGRYLEYTPHGIQVWEAPWIRTFPAVHRHRICLLADRRSCWTLVVVLRAQREWGFWPGGKWVFWKDYIGSEEAEAARSCGD